VDSVQLENNMIYLHDDLHGHVYRALFYNTQYWDDYSKILVLEPSHEIGHQLRSNLEEFKNNFFKNLGITYDPDYKYFDNPGVHIIANSLNKVHNRIANKGNDFKFYIFDTANLEPYNIFDGYPHIRDKSNCIFFTTLRIEESNKKFDFGYILRAFMANKIIFSHFHHNDLFKKLKKEYRLDLCIRNFADKDERIELFRSLLNYEHPKIYLRLSDYYVNRMNYLYTFATEHNDQDRLRTYEFEFETLKRLGNSVANTHPLIIGNQQHSSSEKLNDVTISSDIQILFESNINEHYLNNEKRFCNITEKTIDDLLVEKPFIICDKVTYDFLQHMGFETYENELNINYTDLWSEERFIIKKLKDIVLRIADMDENEYQLMLDKCKIVAQKNRAKCLEYIENNTILEDIINNKI